MTEAGSCESEGRAYCVWLRTQVEARFRLVPHPLDGLGKQVICADY
jgi:hypothetical protein